MLKTSFATLLLLAAGVIAPAMAQDQSFNFHAAGARVDASFASGPLTLPSQAAAAQAMTDFLGTRHPRATVDTLTMERQWQRNGLTHVRFGQQVAGLDVYDTYAQGAVNDQGELVHLMENLATPPQAGLLPVSINAAAALDAALAANHPGVGAPPVAESIGNSTTFVQDDFFWTAPTVTRVAIPMAGGAFQQGYLVETWENASNLLYHTLVAANGRVLGVQLRTNTDSYDIFPDHPDNSTQTITAGPGTGNAESPIGWLYSGNQLSIDIAGNNVRSYLDTDANNAPDPGGVTISTGDFLSVADLTQDPAVFGNQEVAVQNLFYLNNVIHDKLYRHGFVENAGNFQEDNFGNGGQGSDSVNAEAQDGSGLNNANFATPADGSNPRMQMYLWDKSIPRRDGDLDSDIPWHEYGHGLTWRMIGNMSGPMSGAVGEGNSDVLAILTNDNDVVGEYSFNNPLGIRSEPYDNYSRTYGDFSGSSVHFDGEIYAATLWDLKKRYAANAIPLDTLWDDMVGGMNFTPAGPAFEDMRDGILQKAVGSGRECMIWESFAAFGIGLGAQAKVKGGGPFGGNVTVTESFDLPTQCGGGGPSCTPTGDSCSNDADCCSGNCSGGKPSTRVCL